MHAVNPMAIPNEIAHPMVPREHIFCSEVQISTIMITIESHLITFMRAINRAEQQIQ